MRSVRLKRLLVLLGTGILIGVVSIPIGLTNEHLASYAVGSPRNVENFQSLQLRIASAFDVRSDLSARSRAIQDIHLGSGCNMHTHLEILDQNRGLPKLLTMGEGVGLEDLAGSSDAYVMIFQSSCRSAASARMLEAVMQFTASAGMDSASEGQLSGNEPAQILIGQQPDKYVSVSSVGRRQSFLAAWVDGRTVICLSGIGLAETAKQIISRLRTII